jgi:hypothetical protein
MTVATQTISTDPWKFAATATLGSVSQTYIGEEGESRSVVKRIAVKLLESKLIKANASRN